MRYVSKNEEKKNLLLQLSPHIFWNCDAGLLDYNKNKKLIIERIIHYGFERDEILMWKMYGFRMIKKIAMSMTDMDKNKLLYMSSILGVREKRFKCYKKKRFQQSY